MENNIFDSVIVEQSHVDDNAGVPIFQVFVIVPLLIPDDDVKGSGLNQ